MLAPTHPIRDMPKSCRNSYQLPLLPCCFLCIASAVLPEFCQRLKGVACAAITTVTGDIQSAAPCSGLTAVAKRELCTDNQANRCRKIHCEQAASAESLDNTVALECTTSRSFFCCLSSAGRPCAPRRSTASGCAGANQPSPQEPWRFCTTTSAITSARSSVERAMR